MGDSETIFDSNVTYLYRTANDFKIPSSMVIIQREQGETIFDNPVRIIKSSIRRKIPLMEIYENLHNLNQNLDDEIISALYYQELPKPLSRGYLDELNKLYQKIRLTQEIKYRNERDVKQLYDSKKQLMDENMEFDAEVYDTIIAQHDRLSRSKEDGHFLDYSGVNITSTILTLNVLFGTGGAGEEKPEIADGIDVFNELVATRYTPFIQYNNSEGEKFFKILGKTDNINKSTESKGGSALPELMQYVPKNTKKNTIYIIIWVGDVDHVVTGLDSKGVFSADLILNSTASSFYKAEYSLETGLIVINVPKVVRGDQVTDHDNIMERLKVGMPGYTLYKSSEEKIRGTFDIYDVDIDVASFLNLVLSDELFYQSLYAEERLRPYSYKRRLDIHFHNFYSQVGAQAIVNTEEGQQVPLSETNISLTIQQYKTISNTSLPVEHVDENGIKYTEMETFPKNTPWIHVVINGGVSRDMVDACINTLRVLLAVYNVSAPDVINFYNDMMEEKTVRDYTKRYFGRAAKKIEQLQEKEEIKGERRLQKLREQIPELFVDSYGKKCSGAAYLKLLKPTEVAAWEQQTFRVGRKVRHRQVLPFPADDPKYYFGCDDNVIAYPGVRDNTLSNLDKFPYIPSCYKSDHMDPKKDSKYNKYYGHKEIKTQQVKARIQTKTDKIVIEDQIAHVTKSIRNILSHYRQDRQDRSDRSDDRNENTGDWGIVRLGIIQSPNSFLHCVCRALNWKNYEDKDVDEKEAIVIRLRQSISNFIYPELLKQELYNLDANKIQELLDNNKVFFDPDLFFRAVEEYFDVNIYIFGIRRIKCEKKEHVPGYISVPRHKAFHAHTPRSDRETILILRNWGSESDDIDHPHCELIIDYNTKTKEKIMLFDSDDTGTGDGVGRMGDICHRILESVSSTISWFQYKEEAVDLVAKMTYPYENIYSINNYLDILGVTRYDDGTTNLVSQYIDVMGKARGFTVSYNLPKRKDPVDITIIFPPGAPENAPHSDDFAEPDVNDVYEVFRDSRPTSITLDSDALINGIWFEYEELEEGMYIPFKPTKDIPKEWFDMGLALGSINPIAKVSNENNTKRYMRLLRSFDFIKSIIEWLFELYRLETPVGEDVDAEAFAKEILTVAGTGRPTGTDRMTNKVVDSAYYYDFSKMQRRFPPVENFKGGVTYLRKVFPQFSSGKLVAYSQNFFKKLISLIYSYADATLFSEPMIPDAITNFYDISTNFDQHPNNIILMGQDDMDNWEKDQILSQEKVFEIRDKLDLKISLALEPRIYSGDVTSEIWLIQNYYDGSIGGAAAIANIWATQRINPGSHVDPLSQDEIPTHFIYKISTSYKLIPVEDNTGGAADYISLIKYGDGAESRYGALLPLFRSEKAPRPVALENQVGIIPHQRGQANLEILQQIEKEKLSDRPAGARNVYSVDELQKIARSLGLKVSGDKKHLVRVIREQMIRYGMMKD